MIKLIQGDCLQEMPKLPSASVDMILCDLPYGTTKNKWDVVIPFAPLWAQYERLIKPNGAIVLFGQNKFTSALMSSNPKMHRYNLVWDKVLVAGFLNAGRMPLSTHEDICVFYKRLPTYNPQKTKGSKSHSKGKAKKGTSNNYGDFEFVDNADLHGDEKCPISILRFPKPHPSVCIHPTQKPVELMEYLIRTYTNEGETVLDNCMGSGTTGEACERSGRHFIGIENDPFHFSQAYNRLFPNLTELD